MLPEDHALGNIPEAFPESPRVGVRFVADAPNASAVSSDFAKQNATGSDTSRLESQLAVLDLLSRSPRSSPTPDDNYI
jgi:hypothetical protein